MIEVSGLRYAYPGGIRAIDGLSLTAAPGSFTAVMGANGSGKSTLLKHLNGLLEAQSGRVVVDGIAVGRKSFDEVSRRVGLVFQDPNDQIFAPTVREDIAYGPRNLGLDKVAVSERVERAAAQTGIGELLERPIHHLSYGQKKRLSIAGVLAMEPRLLVLDEPTASLDPQGEEQLLKLLMELHAGGLTVVMATHDVDLVPLFATQVCLLSEGRDVLTGTPAEVFSQPEALESCQLRLTRIAEAFEGMVSELPLTVGRAREMLMEMRVVAENGSVILSEAKDL